MQNFLTAFLIAMTAAPAMADEAEIVAADARRSGEGWTFEVTLRHGDTGWDDYADGWEVLTPDGAVIGTRTLYHPHVDEQPFTRSLTGVVLPEGLDHVLIRARTSVEGWGTQRHVLRLPE